MAVEVRIETAPQYNNDHPVQIVFTIINNTDQDIYVLKWQTPLEGLRSDCLKVMVNGHTVPYDSLLIKRGEPRREDYVFIKAGDSVSETVHLDEAYNVSEQGEYVVTFDKTKLVITSADGTELKNLTEARDTTILETVAPPTNFQIEAGAEPRQTKGERLRAEAKKKVVTGLILEAAPQLLGPGFVGGTAGQKRSVGAAHKNGYQYVVDGVKKIGNNENYREWFGNHTTAREERVKNNLISVREALESKPFVYDLTGDGECTDGDYAFTFFEVPTIWICSLFWQAKARGLSSKAGTLVHEHTHSSSSVEDITDMYGEENCRQLAIDKPGDAINNADNYEFFVESTD